MDFKFKQKRYRKPDLQDMSWEGFKIEKPTPIEDNLPGMIQGKTVDSLEEARVAVALDQLGLSFLYQYALFGGDIRGGYFIDFVVEYVPRMIPIEVMGSRWHTGKFAGTFTDDERYRDRRVFDVFGEQIRYIETDVLQDVPSAVIAIKHAINDPVVRRF